MNLGYACINMTLAAQSEKITTNRGMRKKTFLEKGLDYAGSLALLNVKDLQTILEWNVKNDITFFRVSSDIFPWASHYDLDFLKRVLKSSTSSIFFVISSILLHPWK